MIIVSYKNQSQSSTLFLFSDNRPNQIQYTYEEIMLKNDELTDFQIRK